MCGFFQERGYPSDLLLEDLRKISSINRLDIIYNHREENSQAGRIPLVLTHHPLNEKIKKFRLATSAFLTTTQRPGRSLLTRAPLVAYRRDRNIRKNFRSHHRWKSIHRSRWYRSLQPSKMPYLSAC